MILVQIRGMHGTGKTSLARAILNTGDFVEEEITVCGGKYPINYDHKRNIIVTGKYGTASCGGLDGKIVDRMLMLEYLAAIMLKKPTAIVFEAVMYGITCKFTQELARVCAMYGYRFKAIALFCDFETLLQRIYSRNGGKNINVEATYKKYKHCNDSDAKLQMTNIPFAVINTTDKTKQQVLEAFRKEVGYCV